MKLITLAFALLPLTAATQQQPGVISPQSVSEKSASAGPKVLTSDELGQIFPGKTLRSTNSQGHPHSYEFFRDGRVIGKGVKDSDHGVWQPKNDQLCVEMDLWDRGVERCWPIEQLEDGRYRYTTNRMLITFDR